MGYGTKNKDVFRTLLKIYDEGIRHNNCCLKSILIQSFSGPYFPAFGLNTKRYSILTKANCFLQMRTVVFMQKSTDIVNLFFYQELPSPIRGDTHMTSTLRSMGGGAKAKMRCYRM